MTEATAVGEGRLAGDAHTHMLERLLGADRRRISAVPHLLVYLIPAISPRGRGRTE